MVKMSHAEIVHLENIIQFIKGNSRPTILPRTRSTLIKAINEQTIFLALNATNGDIIGLTASYRKDVDRTRYYENGSSIVAPDWRNRGVHNYLYLIRTATLFALKPMDSVFYCQKIRKEGGPSKDPGFLTKLYVKWPAPPRGLLDSISCKLPDGFRSQLYILNDEKMLNCITDFFRIEYELCRMSDIPFFSSQTLRECLVTRMNRLSAHKAQ